MLLRRITTHIKEQNWFAVIVDLLVVVIGIYLGMQASDWSQYHLDRQTEVVYLERLNNDITKDLESLEDAIKLQVGRLERADFLMQSDSLLGVNLNLVVVK